MNAQQFSDKIFQFKGERKEAFNTANSQKKKKKNPRLTKYPYTTKSVLHFLEEKKVNERKKKKSRKRIIRRVLLISLL